MARARDIAEELLAASQEFDDALAAVRAAHEARKVVVSELIATGCLPPSVVANGKDIGFTIGTAALTGGSLRFHCWWVPISEDGLVVPGTGGSL